MFLKLLETSSLIKDSILISALGFLVIGCVYLYNANRQSQEKINKMMSEIERISQVDSDDLKA